MHTFTVDAPDVSTAWRRACHQLIALPEAKGYHTLVRIADPCREDPEVRAALERLRLAKAKQPMEAVVNTVFPVALAATSKDHDHLVQRYTALYPRLRAAERRNVYGTYFGRLVCYPNGTGTPVDQLGALIARLRKISSSSQWKAVYEIGTAYVTDGNETPDSMEAIDGDSGNEPPDLPVRIPAGDTQVLDFPCLSHLSFQLDGRTGTVHTAAYYRSHYMFDRAYGNYLALGQLNRWVAQQAGLVPGALSVMSGVARLECPKSYLDIVDASAQGGLFELPG